MLDAAACQCPSTVYIFLVDYLVDEFQPRNSRRDSVRQPRRAALILSAITAVPRDSGQGAVRSVRRHP